MFFCRLQKIASEKETDKQETDSKVQPEMGVKMMMRTIGDEESSKKNIMVCNKVINSFS